MRKSIAGLSAALTIAAAGITASLVTAPVAVADPPVVGVLEPTCTLSLLGICLVWAPALTPPATTPPPTTTTPSTTQPSPTTQSPPTT